MTGQIFIKPAEGLLVRDPQTREPLPAEGSWKLRSTYWVRRLADSDVVETSPPEESTPTKTDKKTKEVTS